MIIYHFFAWLIGYAIEGVSRLKNKMNIFIDISGKIVYIKSERNFIKIQQGANNDIKRKNKKSRSNI